MEKLTIKHCCDIVSDKFGGEIITKNYNIEPPKVCVSLYHIKVMTPIHKIFVSKNCLKISFDVIGEDCEEFVDKLHGEQFDSVLEYISNLCNVFYKTSRYID